MPTELRAHEALLIIELAVRKSAAPRVVVNVQRLAVALGYVPHAQIRAPKKVEVTLRRYIDALERDPTGIPGYRAEFETRSGRRCAVMHKLDAARA